MANQWDAFKATMRGVFATETRNFSKTLNSDMTDAEIKATDAEREYIQYMTHPLVNTNLGKTEHDNTNYF